MRPFLMNVNLRYDSVSEGTLARALKGQCAISLERNTTQREETPDRGLPKYGMPRLIRGEQADQFN